MHPYLAQNDLKKYCKEKGIAITAYTPSGASSTSFSPQLQFETCATHLLLFLGYSTVRNDPVIVDLAKKYNATPNQIILAWHISHGTIVVPKSENAERQKENIAVRCLLILE